MKKRKEVLLALFCAFLLGVSIKVEAEDNGSLQLNPNIITNSDGGVGNSSSFSFIGELFTPEVNETVTEQMQDDIPEQRAALDFTKEAVNSLYTTDTSQISQQLFINYQPVVIPSGTEESEKQSTIWYWLILITAIPLVFLAISLGQKQAKRRLKKER